MPASSWGLPPGSTSAARRQPEPVCASVAAESGVKILVIRRDNIGDLVCTTPLIRALRQRFPEAWIGALVNSYNAPVLRGNPDLNEVFAYRKLKHRDAGESLLVNLWARHRLLAALRRQSLDYVVMAGNTARAMGFSRLLHAKKTVGFTSAGARPDIAVTADGGGHEVDLTFRLAQALGISGPPPVPAVYPDPAVVARLRSELAQRLPGVKTLVGIHISARKPSQRWPIECFAQLAREIAGQGDVGILLFWSPGPETDPRHPGDDEKAEVLIKALRGLPSAAVPTHELGELVAGLSLCDRVICSDGGAMHIAAALAKPIVCLFGGSDAVRWHPWGVPHVLLQSPSRDVREIGVAEVLEAVARLRQPV
jgi:heptosyltransferase III